MVRGWKAAADYLDDGGHIDADGSNFADLVDVVESMANLVRRARASAHSAGGLDDG